MDRVRQMDGTSTYSAVVENNLALGSVEIFSRRVPNSWIGRSMNHTFKKFTAALDSLLV